MARIAGKSLIVDRLADIKDGSGLSLAPSGHECLILNRQLELPTATVTQREQLGSASGSPPPFNLPHWLRNQQKGVAAIRRGDPYKTAAPTMQNSANQ
ncbi:MAG: hypothetical protein M1813_005495 [Trichoglossum hirsutum]|nr:MAG: hypothetical protein M1813_005495 [Trichoglossum hirsutum]